VVLPSRSVSGTRHRNTSEQSKPLILPDGLEVRLRTLPWRRYVDVIDLCAYLVEP